MIIGVCGKAGSGKSTFAEVLCCNLNFSMWSFAEPLKEMVEVITRSNRVWGTQEDKSEMFEPLGLTYRELLQRVGEGMRKVDKDFWVKLLAPKVLNAHDYYDIVIPDVRFTNEAKWIKANGGKIVQIVRPDNPYTVPEHVSERGFNQRYIDYTLYNIATGLELYRDMCYDTMTSFLL